MRVAGTVMSLSAASLQKLCGEIAIAALKKESLQKLYQETLFWQTFWKDHDGCNTVELRDSSC